RFTPELLLLLRREGDSALLDLLEQELHLDELLNRIPQLIVRRGREGALHLRRLGADEGHELGGRQRPSAVRRDLSSSLPIRQRTIRPTRDLTNDVQVLRGNLHVHAG